MVKILIISDAWHPQTNGVVTTYKEIKQALHTDGHDIKVIGPDNFMMKAPCPLYKDIKLTLPLFLGKKIRKYKPKRIHIATEGPLGWAARHYCTKRGIKFSSFYHTKFPEYLSIFTEQKLKMPFLQQWAEDKAYAGLRKFHESSTVLLVTTEGMKNELKDNGFTPPMSIVTRGVNEDYFHLGEKNLFQDLPKPIALYAGRVSHEKT